MKLDETAPELDYTILRDGAISMYHRHGILDQDLKVLESLGYRIVDFNAGDWTRKSCHLKLKSGLEFPDYYGENLDAFNDCLSDSIPPNKKGLVIVFRNFDEFANSDKNYCEALLDVIANQSRQWLLSQRRLIGLIQSKEPDLYFGKIGGFSPTWNGQEWFNADRRGKM